MNLTDILNSNSLKTGDTLETTDIDGECVFQVAHITKKYVYFIRKYVLDDERSHPGPSRWLDNYAKSLPTELQDILVKKNNHKVFLPSEANVFGSVIYGKGKNDKDYTGKQWEIFKTRSGRRRFFSSGETALWWLSSPYVGSTTTFCSVGTSGAPNYYYASYANGILPGFRILRKSK